ncbi:type IV pilus twitching motility protein PilT [Sporosarcina trichiuri]|uniref:type IV pilus twitching motility protein PilT n=1 Tax=Sporosarcina trichiuri TaxID=3056445 RepID=UPI0025B4D33A|nr:type IV pilus twitching motility protein PilT [Sporosarcina sp. 0.2-SM1T-5]WJY28961.1 type IV pilus twitching motility protein PilT [Sporosarcina sp. 0.2-SM1T-5]
MKDQINDVLAKAVELHASDIHLTIGSPPVFRINGDLKRYGTEPIDEQYTKGAVQATVPDKLFPEFREHGQVDYSYDVPGVARFRVNAFQQRGVTSLAFRTIPTDIPTIESLHMPGILKTLAETKQGLILVTGPTGSGKSTTLASMIDYLNQTSRKHILTLEDPIEYMHSHAASIIDQREVGFDAATFADGLRAALRQDPDVILVGEMRDLETISTAITAAETGHLVLATLHTWSAASTIDRIIDVFPHGQQAQIRVQLAGVLTAVLSQRLLPTSDRQGRRAATELMINNPAVANLIRSEKVHQIPNVIQTNRAAGMHMMNTSVKELLDKGLISYDTAEPYLQEES